MEHSEYQELLAAHALGALAAPEERALAAHLDSCGECRDELAEMQDAAALLAHATEPAAPGDEVRRRIMRDIQGPCHSTAVDEHDVVTLSHALSSAWPSVMRLAAAIAFVAMLLGLIVLWRRDASSRREMAKLARQLGQQQRELQIERDNVTRQTEALALLNSPDARKIVLSGTPTAQAARATFMYDEKSHSSVLMIEGLPPTPADKAYEVWFIPKGLAPIPGRTFTVNANGRAMISDSMPAAAGSAPVIAITMEPKSGSATPTEPIYLASPAT